MTDCGVSVDQRYKRIGALDENTKAFVQKIADETVRSFYGR